MKTPAPLSNAINHLMTTAVFVRRIPEQFFGNVSWKPPRWLSWIGKGWSRLEGTYPRLIVPAILTLFAILGAGAWTWNWYSHLPKARKVLARVETIARPDCAFQLTMARGT
jgi:hypothetical protein